MSATMSIENHPKGRATDEEDAQFRANALRIALGLTLGGSILVYRAWQERHDSNQTPRRDHITSPDTTINPADGLEDSIGGADIVRP